MSEQDINEMKLVINTLQQELKYHTESSILFRKGVDKNFDDIKNDIKRHIVTYPEKQKSCMKSAQDYTNKAIGLTLGVPGFIILVLNVMEHFK